MSQEDWVQKGGFTETFSETAASKK